MSLHCIFDRRSAIDWHEGTGAKARRRRAFVQNLCRLRRTEKALGAGK